MAEALDRHLNKAIYREVIGVKVTGWSIYESLEKTYNIEEITELEKRWTKCIVLKQVYVEK